MKKQTVIVTLLVMLSLLLFSCKSQKDTYPNVLFILVDDLGWKDLGSYGSEFYDTPNLDSLAARGIRFTNAYSASPVCSPTRAAIMTGKHPVRVGITDWIPGMPIKKAKSPELIPPEDIHNLPLEEFTLAEAFREWDYKTFFAGKWHLSEDSTYWPEHQGFDINRGGHDKGSPPGGYYSPYENPRLEDGPEGEYLTDRLTAESIRFLEQAARQQDPFFLYLAFYTVHTPIEGCKRYDEHYKNKKLELPDQGKPQIGQEHHGQTRLNQSNYKYAAMVRCMDENVGRLLNALKEHKLYEDTIIVLTSDNGGLTTLPAERGIAPTSVYPLWAGKGWLYEGGIRIPLIVKAPGKSEGEVSRQPVTSMDLYPTLLKLAGLPMKDQQHLDGKSIVPYLEDPQRVDARTLVWHYPHYHGSAWRPGSAIRVNNWKLIEFHEEDKVELYDLNKDIREQNDLAEIMPEKAKELHGRLIQWRQTVNAKMPHLKPVLKTSKGNNKDD